MQITRKRKDGQMSSMNRKDSNSQANRASFSGKFGYILAVAGSAVGLGNIWRFPYLAAKYGGGIFLLVYLILVVSFGYALVVSETAIGRMTKQSPVGAYRKFGSSFGLRFGGWINAIVPMIIVPYYCVIGGWVAKYLYAYLCGEVTEVATDTYFTSFIADSWDVQVWFLVFFVASVLVILGGVKNGVEKVSKIMMPLLIVLAVIVAIYSVTRPGAMEGVKYFLIPNLENFSFMTIVAAMGQMFYSLSLAMGVLYTYGSYLENDVDIETTTKQIEVFDTAIAVLAGLMIIPAVFAFSGGDVKALNAGPSLMFITIPKVFADMGMGRLIGFVFFLMVLFAALTSSISLLETSVSTISDELGLKRGQSILLMSVLTIVIGTCCALGFGVWDMIAPMGMTILDFLDFLSNSIMMPIAALCTCVLVVKIIGFDALAKEIRQSSAFQRERLYRICIRYLAPICILIILISSIASAFGWIQI